MKTPHSTKCFSIPARAALAAHTPVRRPAGDTAIDGTPAPRAHAVPHVLHIDADKASALTMIALLSPEARVTSVTTIKQAETLLAEHSFALVVLDPTGLEVDPVWLLPRLHGTRLLVHSTSAPSWHVAPGAYLAKPWTSARHLWIAVAGMLGIPTFTKSGD